MNYGQFSGAIRTRTNDLSVHCEPVCPLHPSRIISVNQNDHNASLNIGTIFQIELLLTGLSITGVLTNNIRPAGADPGFCNGGGGVRCILDHLRCVSLERHLEPAGVGWGA